jgi:hypothetical protein
MNFLASKSPSNKNTIKLARNELIKSPLKYRERRKSYIPQNALAFIRNNDLNQIKPEATKYSCKGDHSSKKKYLKETTNTNIPEEESENFNKFSVKKNKKGKKVKKNKKEKKDKKENQENQEIKNEIENNNYYIHYIKNVYEDENHLNKKNIIKSADKENNEIQVKFLESNRNVKPFHKRRNSALNRNIFKSNLNNVNLLLDKEQLNQKLPFSIINKKKSAEISTLIPKNNLDEKKKEIIKSFLHKNSSNKNKSKHKNKERKKSKDKEKEKEKNKGKDKEKNKEKEKENENDKVIDLENNDDDNKKKDEYSNQKEKELLENEIKTEMDTNNKSSKIKKKRKLKFLCCFFGNNDSSFEND